MRAKKMILNLLVTEQEWNLQNRDYVNIGNGIYKFILAFAVVFMIFLQTCQSDLYLSKSLFFRGDASLPTLNWRQSPDLKTRLDGLTFERSNIQTAIKYKMSQEICIDKNGNHYNCP
jgi:hypothetical protein